MTTMHIGTRDFSALYALLPVTEARPHVRIAGTPNGSPDSWEAWGHYIEDYSDGGTHPHHVIVQAETTDLLLADLKRVYEADPTLLKPMRTGEHRGTLVALTMDDPRTWHHQMRRTESELRDRFARQERCQHDSVDEIGVEPDGSTISLCVSCRDIWNDGVGHAVPEASELDELKAKHAALMQEVNDACDEALENIDKTAERLARLQARASEMKAEAS